MSDWSMLSYFRLDPNKRKILGNFFSLSLLQMANYIFPLITLPYLVRVLGPERFGLVSFAQAFVQYFGILTDYGFNLSATREISVHREVDGKVSEIFSAVMSIKVGLLVLSFVIMGVIVFSFERFRREWLIYYLTFGVLIGRVLFPVWFFQGMERMKYITILNVISRLAFTVSVFVFIRVSSDYVYVPLLNFLASLVSGVLAIRVVFNKFDVCFKLPDVSLLTYHLKRGWYVFVSDVAISLYTVSNTFLLGLFTDNATVGYYSAYERIVRAVAYLFSPLFQSVYPFFNALYRKDLRKFKKYHGKLLWFTLLVSLILTVVLLVFSRQIIILVLGKMYLCYIDGFWVMSFLVFIVASAGVILDIGFLSMELDKHFMKVYLCGGLLNVALILILVGYFRLSVVGASISVVSTEAVVTAAAFVVLKKRLGSTG